MPFPRKTNRARRVALGLALAALLHAAPALAAPVLFYSDLDSAPGGAYVTVWGTGFGTTPGSLHVGSAAVGGANVLSWAEGQVAFRLPSGAGNGISLTDGAGHTSNTLAFTTRANGKRYFVSKADGSDRNNGLAETSQGGRVGPWKTLRPVLGKVAPGDVVYVRSGTYDEVLSARFGITFYVTGKQGKAERPIALVAYPGEFPTIGSESAGKADFLFEGGISNWTLAGLHMVGRGYAVKYWGHGGHIRIVRNTADRFDSNYGTFEINDCTGCKVLGNHVHHSGLPGNKFSHLIYYTGNGPASGLEIAWNVVHDEVGGRGIQVYGHAANETLSGLSIHDNVVYNIALDGILVGASDAASGPWISDALVYNNVVYNAGGRGFRVETPGLSLRLLHNTAYRNGTSVSLNNAGDAEVRNNIFASPTGSQFSQGGNHTITMDHNGYFGAAAPPQDMLPVTGDPRFTDAAAGDFSLGASSPFRGAGVALSPPLPEMSVPASSSPDLGALGWVRHGVAPNTVVAPTRSPPPSVRGE